MTQHYPLATAIYFIIKHTSYLPLNQKNWRLREKWKTKLFSSVILTPLSLSCNEQRLCDSFFYFLLFRTLCFHLRLELWLCFQTVLVTTILYSIEVEITSILQRPNQTPPNSGTYPNRSTSLKAINVDTHCWNDNCLGFWFGSVNICCAFYSHQGQEALRMQTPKWAGRSLCWLHCFQTIISQLPVGLKCKALWRLHIRWTDDGITNISRTMRPLAVHVKWHHCLSQSSNGPNGLAAESRCECGTNVRKESDGAWHRGLLQSLRNNRAWIRALVGRTAREQRPSPRCPQAGTSSSQRSRCQMEAFWCHHSVRWEALCAPCGTLVELVMRGNTCQGKLIIMTHLFSVFWESPSVIKASSKNSGLSDFKCFVF